MTEKTKQVATIIKGRCYYLPTYKKADSGQEEVVGNLSLKFCNEKNGLNQEGVSPNDLLTAVCRFVEEEDYAHKDDIVALLEGTMNIIEVAQKKKRMNGRN